MSAPAPAPRTRARIFMREMGGGVTTSMLRWMQHARGEAEVSVVTIRDITRPFVPIESPMPSDTQRVVYNGLLDNKRRVYSLCAAGTRPDEYLIANDVIELGMFAALGLRNPVAFILHGDYEYYYDLAAAHASQIGSFLCVSARVRDELVRLLPSRTDDIHVAYPIVPEPRTRRSPTPPDDPIRLLFVGRITEEKGFPDLPLIDRQLAAQGVNARWTIVAPHYDQSSRLETSWLTQKHVHHIEHVPEEELSALYARHDVLVFPSRFEGFGMAVLEAMKSGVVPVASRLAAGIPEMIDDGVTGFLSPVGDWQSMASHVQMLSADRDKLEAMAVSAGESSVARFDSTVCGESMTRAIFAARPRVQTSVAPSYLSRMDRAWIPNPVVRAARSLMRVARPGT